jgi:hypothetical protein
VFQFLAVVKDFSLVNSIQTSSGPHPASCLVGTRSSFSRGKVVEHESDHSPLVLRTRIVELYLQTPYAFMAYDGAPLSSPLTYPNKCVSEIDMSISAIGSG